LETHPLKEIGGGLSIPGGKDLNNKRILAVVYQFLLLKASIKNSEIIP
jgi:hypothetical protein